MLTRPSWIQFGDDRRTIRFLWDDLRVNHDFKGDATAVMKTAPRMSVRARLALLVGLYEWIVWRFDGLHHRDEPKQILDAAWCATVDPRYLKFYELPRVEWVGPIEGPLWCAFTYLEHGFREAHQNHADTYLALEFVYLLALHVLPGNGRFETWSAQTLERFMTVYPLPPDDPFADLFEERIGEHLGQFVGRDALDPAVPVHVARDRAFLTRLLQQVRGENNPFLASEGDLQDRGFEGDPYVLPQLAEP